MAASLQRIQRTVVAAAIGVQALVEDMLYLARRDSKDRGVTKDEAVDRDTVVVAATARFCRAGGTTIDGSGVEPSRVRGDAVALGRMVSNLVENAVRYAGSKVAVSVFPKGTVVRLTVVDDGPGIPEADRERVFERFVRLDEARAGDDVGAGLGLAIVKEIVEIHNGTVRIEPSVRGARLVVDLPGE